jgi:tetratricopeptide (TPR) repeat protein
LQEAESVICGNILSRGNSEDDIVNEFGEMAPYTLSLLGNIYRKTERFSKAAENYRRSMKLNPFLWSAFESLCQIGKRGVAVMQRSVITLYPPGQDSPPSRCRVGVKFWAMEFFQHVEFLSEK